MMKYTETKIWSMDSVRRACIKNDLFTLGDNDTYERMLKWVERHNPDLYGIQVVAELINKYSENQDVPNIMYIIANEAVITTYEAV